MSILGEKIKAAQKHALEDHVPKVIDYWWLLADNCGEVGENYETFTAHFHPQDNKDAWESLCVITDVYSSETLADLVGITINFCNSTHAEVKYSGK